MSTQRIEIYPGVTIEVSGRLKRKAGVGRMKLVRNKLDDAERRRIMGDSLRAAKRADNPKVKYPTLLLDEAVRLSKEVGNKEAAKITGVKFWSLIQRKRELIKQGKYEKNRYTEEQIKQCSELAKSLVGSAYTYTTVAKRKHTINSALTEASKRMGINNLSMKMYFYKGLRGLAQQPSTPVVTSGACASTAKPHAQ